MQWGACDFIFSTMEYKDKARHKPAIEYVDFLGTKFLDFLKKGYWMLLPYTEVQNMLDLRLSPLGTCSSLAQRAEGAMQSGKAIERLLKQAAQAHPRFGPLLHYKVDILDGFHHITLAMSGVKKLRVLLPPFPGLPSVAFPLVLPMGWTDSPLFLCVLIETVCDSTNNKELNKNVRHPKTCFEDTTGKLDFLDCKKLPITTENNWMYNKTPQL
jgi:hypothetical protein